MHKESQMADASRFKLDPQGEQRLKIRSRDADGSPASRCGEPGLAGVKLDRERPTT